MKQQNNFTVELEVDTAPLISKLNLLLELKSSVFEGIHDMFISKSFDFSLNSAINDSDIVTSQLVSASGTGIPDKLLCVLDFDIINFIRKWLVTVRASNSNLNSVIHNNSSSCRGD